MQKFEYDDIRFKEENDKVRVIFLKNYYSFINKRDLDGYKIIDNGICVGCSEKKFNKLLVFAFENLIDKITGNKTTYVHKNSGIPLMGNLSFGIIDKGSEMIELKPITGCNINCIFCSVDEGPDSKKSREFVIEKDYIVDELKKLIEFKEDKVDIYINPHGEPLLYSDIVSLVKDIHKINSVEIISIITNGVLLTKKLCNDLIDSGLNQINISLNSLRSKKAKEIAGCEFNSDKLVENILYLKDRIKVIISPVYMQGMNESDIEEIIKFCKENNIEILIQNFQFNKRGRKPVKELKMEKFVKILEEWENKYDIPLLKKGYKSRKTKQYKMPFRKEEIIPVERVIKGRYDNEFFAVSNERLIILNCDKKKINKIKITKSKNNIFYGVPI